MEHYKNWGKKGLEEIIWERDFEIEIMYTIQLFIKGKLPIECWSLVSGNNGQE